MSVNFEPCSAAGARDCTFFRSAIPVFTADSKTFTFVCWYKLDDLSALDVSSTDLFVICPIDSATGSLTIVSNSVGGVSLVGLDSLAATAILAVTTLKPITIDTWNCLMIGADTAAGALSIYHNDTDITPASPTINDKAIDLTSGLLWIGTINGSTEDSPGGVSGSISMDGVIDYVYFSTTYTDFTVEDNRRKFYSEAGDRIGLGDRGRDPLGVVPEVLLNKGPGNFGDNVGTGPNLTGFNSPTFAYGPPSGTETVSRGFRGERWRESDRSGIPFPESELVVESATGNVVARREHSTDRDEINRNRRRNATSYERD